MTEVSDLKIKVTVEGVDGAVTELKRMKKELRRSLWVVFVKMLGTAFAIASAVACMRGNIPMATWLMLCAIYLEVAS